MIFQVTHFKNLKGNKGKGRELLFAALLRFMMVSTLKGQGIFAYLHTYPERYFSVKFQWFAVVI